MVIFYYSCNLGLNALFYTNKKISEKYNYDENNLVIFTLINNITISLFSTLVNFAIVIIFRILINPRKAFEKVFSEEEKKVKKYKKNTVVQPARKKIISDINSVFSRMKIRNIIFIVCELLLMLFFSYFITAFCCVYKNTQTSWLLDWISSFFLSILLEFVISMFISSIYKASISYKLEFLYNFVTSVYSVI